MWKITKLTLHEVSGLLNYSQLVRLKTSVLLISVQGLIETWCVPEEPEHFQGTERDVGPLWFL